MSVCKECPLQITCLIQDPKRTFGGLPPLRAHGCVYYHCPVGVAAAREALASGDAETILLENEPMTAYIFGSPTKPTDHPKALIHRYVTDDGRIMATSPDGSSIVFTGQTIESLAVAWRMLP